MAMEISMVSVGAVFLLVLLSLVLILGKRDTYIQEKDKASKSVGKYLIIVLIFSACGRVVCVFLSHLCVF